MAHEWDFVRKSRIDAPEIRRGHVADLTAVLANFERSEGDQFRLHESVREFLGLVAGEQVIDPESLQGSPFPFLHSHSSYLFGVLASPTSTDDGIPEFTVLHLVCTPSRLLTVVLDAPTSTDSDFSRRLVERRDMHIGGGGEDIGATVLALIGDCVSSLNRALRQLSAEVESCSDTLFSFGSRETRGNFEMLREVETRLITFHSEIESLTTVAEETAGILARIASDETEIDGPSPIFGRRDEIAAQTLAMQARQMVSIRARLEDRSMSLLTKCEQLRGKFFVEATHRIGAVAALLLVPTFIVGMYGQNLRIPERDWEYGYLFSWLLIVVSTTALIVFFRRKKWL